MSRPRLIKKLKKKNPQLSQSDLEEILDIFSNGIEKALLDGKKIELRGFGSFFVKKSKKNTGTKS